MKILFTLIKNNLRILVVKKPAYTTMMIICPIIISVFLSTFLNTGASPIKVGIMDSSKTISSKKIVSSIEKNKTMEVINIESLEAFEKGFSSKDIDVAIIIDEDFEYKLLNGDTSGVLIKGLEEENIYKIISEVVAYDVGSLKKLVEVNNGDYNGYKISLGMLEANSIEISKESLNDLYGDYSNSQTLVGILVMFAFFRAMSGSILIGEDKEQYIYTRVLVAPVKIWQYYLSNIISTLMLILIQSGLSIIGINILTDINMGMSSVELFMVLSFVSLVAVSIGCFCVTITDSRDLSSIISNFILMTFLFIGGCFVPVSLLSDTLNKISYFTPTRWAMEAVINLQEGADISVILSNLGVLILFAAAFFITAIYFITRRDRVDSLI